jgi:hypothetical protein
LLVKLRQEALIVRPKEANVGDAKEHHGDALETDAKGPATAIGETTVFHQLWVNDARAQHLEPLVVPEDLRATNKRKAIREEQVIALQTRTSSSKDGVVNGK